MIILASFFSWIMVLGCLYETNDYGGAKHRIPYFFKVIFPFISRITQKATLMDLFGIVFWHIYLYSWIVIRIMVIIMHYDLKTYELGYLMAFVFLLIIYAPYGLLVGFKSARWEDKHRKR